MIFANFALNIFQLNFNMTFKQNDHSMISMTQVGNIDICNTKLSTLLEYAYFQFINFWGNSIQTIISAVVTKDTARILDIMTY